MICFCHFCKKKFCLFWVWLILTHFLEVLANIFRTTGLQLKLLRLIESPNIFHWKPAKKPKIGVVLGQNLGQIRSNFIKKSKDTDIINRFFSYFAREI